MPSRFSNIVSQSLRQKCWQKETNKSITTFKKNYNTNSIGTLKTLTLGYWICNEVLMKCFIPNFFTLMARRHKLQSEMLLAF